MKEGIHPEYVEAVVKCVCGAKVKTRSVAGDITVETCSKCHPFYTGKQGQLKVAGRAEKFKKKYSKADK